MIVFKDKEQNKTLVKPKEIRLHCRAVSRGIAIGKAVCLKGNAPEFFKSKISLSKVDEEIERLDQALDLAKINLENLDSASPIFTTHLLILEDKKLLEKIKNRIQKKRVNAEWAVNNAFDEYIEKFQGMSDKHLRERSIDLMDIRDRILSSFNGEDDKKIKVPNDSIIILKNLKPTTFIELAQNKPKAIITENGGWTSHSFILAREINLPAITGVKNIFSKINSGDVIIADGYSGQIIVNPESKTVDKYSLEAAKVEELNSKDYKTFKSPLKTLDGKEITIRANLDFQTDFSKAKDFGAKGVGLFRSEYLFNKFKEYPSEEEQVESYRKVGKIVGDEGVNIRTFDLSIEQFEKDSSEKAINPALGLHGIRLSLTNKNEFQTQIRAILRASADFQINLILPMITSVSEILISKNIINEEKENLSRKKIKFGDPKIGAMIEVPAAVLTIEDIADEVDFVNLGTNDLVQYLLAVDRDNESVADWFRTLHPSVLIAVEKVLQTAEKKGIPAIVCGEIAGSPFYAPILIGLGATELSMNINSIPRLKKTVSGIAFEEAVEIVNDIKKCRTADEIEGKIRQCYIKKWSHLFSPDILPPGKHI